MTLPIDQQARALVLLPQLILFEGCSPAELDALIKRLERRSYLKGKVIMMEQELSKTLYFLAVGKVGIWKHSKPEKKLLAVLEAPEVFGETSMFTTTAATALVKAESDVECWFISEDAFNDVSAAQPALLPKLQANVTKLHAKRGIKPKPTEE